MVAHVGPDLQVLNAEQADPLPSRARVAVAYDVMSVISGADQLEAWLAVELQDRLLDPGSVSVYVGSEVTAGTNDALFLRAGYVFGDLDQEAGARVGLGLRYERFDLAIAKSLAVSTLTGETEPVHVTFSVVFIPGTAVSQDSANDVSAQGAAGRSLILPGWGQLELGQRRGWAYALAEAALWVVWADRRSAGGTLRDQYRDFAWETGRIRSGTRVDGSFTYYETLSTWVRSGAFDADPDAEGIQPEENASTFNGSIWRRATGLFVPPGSPLDPTDASYRRALEYYRDRAYRTAFLWDWSGREQDRLTLGDLIRQSDDRFRQATAALGAVLANHLLSGVDAYVSARLRHSSEIRLTPPNRLPGTGWALTLRLDGVR